MVKKITIKPYRQVRNRKVYIIKQHRKRARKVGKPKFKKIGTFFVGQDKYGNVVGSKIVKFKKKVKKK